MNKFIGNLTVAFPKFLILFEKLTFIGLGDNVKLVEAGELSMVFFEVVFKVRALVFENPNFLHEMVKISGRRPFFLPIRNIDFILALMIGMDLYILVHTDGVTAL